MHNNLHLTSYGVITVTIKCNEFIEWRTNYTTAVHLARALLYDAEKVIKMWAKSICSIRCDGNRKMNLFARQWRSNHIMCLPTLLKKWSFSVWYNEQIIISSQISHVVGWSWHVSDVNKWIKTLWQQARYVSLFITAAR